MDSSRPQHLLRMQCDEEPQTGELRRVIQSLAQRKIKELLLGEQYLSKVPNLTISSEASCIVVFFHNACEVKCDGDWQMMAAQTAAIFSSLVQLRQWQDTPLCFAAITYQNDVRRENLTVAGIPCVAAPILHAMRGLHAEAEQQPSGTACYLWIELIDHYGQTILHHEKIDPRMEDAWRTIVRDLNQAWCVPSMAKVAKMSPEHFRRLCLQAFGQAPMAHLTMLRLARAENLLRTTNLKLDAICEEVGYEYRSTFSNIFFKNMGVRPSAYRDALHKK
ncbi:MAG: AraC family transcriptional regulator [Verrucomicrobia bacterium]|nr:MAG: AraC family transcriptional regulator [Verrucomicrobiota bacterium]